MSHPSDSTQSARRAARRSPLPISYWLLPTLLVAALMAAPFAAPRPAASEQVAMVDDGALSGRIDELVAPRGAAPPQGRIGWTGNDCGSCHRPDTLFSHPVGVTPSMKVPDHLPLSNGKLTCVTCHDHGDSTLHAEARRDHTPMLRQAPASTSMTSTLSQSPQTIGRRANAATGNTAFCQQCHSLEARDRANAHGAALGFAHLRWQGKDAKAQPRQGRLDGESQTCMSCHDGSVATDIGVGDDMGFSDAARSHPIAVPHGVYRDKKGRIDRNVPFVSIGGVDKRIRFFDGQLGCGSCHSPFAREDKLLVMSNRGSKLCLSCHAE